MIQWVASVITCLALGILAVPLAAEAQQAPKTPRIAFVQFPCDRPAWSDFFVRPEKMRQALRDRGYIEGQNLNAIGLCADEKSMLSIMIGDWVRLEPAAIIAIGTEAIQAAMGGTRSVPIVMISFGDPVELGFVGSLARPGGNVTGVTLMTSELAAKRLEILKEVVPRVSRVGVLGNPTNATSARELRATQGAAKALGVTLTSVEVRTTSDFDRAFVSMADSRVGGLIALTDSVIYAHAGRIARFAINNKLPTMYGFRDFVMAGGLMSYEPSADESARRVATYVDKILKGAKPGDLPVEQPTKFELVINLKTAKALGLTIPQSVLIRADEVIQ